MNALIEEMESPVPDNRWQADSLRFTLFPTIGLAPPQSSWWARIVGDEPETSVSQPRQGTLIESGAYAGQQLTLAIQANRLDWTVTPSEESQQSEGPPSIGPFAERLEGFVRLIHTWFSSPSCPKAKRLAFGAGLIQNVPDRATGYRRLQPFLKAVSLDPDRSSDFVYQINRPRNSKRMASGLKLNRLSKWMVAIWSRALVLEPALTSNPIIRTQKHFSQRLELDISTDQEFQAEFAPSDAAQIFSELVDLGIEISINGDIP